ncbi:MAG TPA: bifunctional phosphopantothenoylcysteine decarboxylase/phosphopantothenate--cysteine ligase CoaBC [Thermoanaerobacterales bacterium]|uniref:bifunctional phosphopantothenoylcysteine decarboxylase/phosphopantothenate--cysteine ligase CoaBC n=1 Tax=Tepidanaerobacter sp. GT38 TaxID=2722793 RepID=UPI0017C28016|nr:bifunctional phosphopantothenoylcysteine decarboxylase/phosphopantothenate--cysteine ligase CoaBC [Tepidanaerobacter sp. GT38]MCG1012099.1 bifunctional phosphopantothenoylcysteine decarboxylase/phosphopantothenate--cysteine ligase CoaBC [Tepidanaerobacter sp. GT38]HHY43032.1 bifunctional phosphopantothenoylcysteine decarboxylase/phosphopantothenate--cysteine ligase CoaBC [Thermoanaerobacterales bacterium]
MLKGKFVVLGVTGSIAAYKAVELVRLLKKAGCEVQVIMTKSGCEFVKPLTFQVVSQNPVIIDMFKEPSRWEVEHVALADKADVFLVAPATANIIAKMAAGIADDMLTSTLLATKAKIIVVPAMNVNMYENPITQRNIAALKALGITVLDPEEGDLACGYSGKGRFPEPTDIVEHIKVILGKDGDLKDKRFLITAGPTREPIDPVRFITNHSSGKMGYALAEKAVQRGARVTLISGPTNLTPPLGLERFIRVDTAEEMYSAVMKHYADVDVVIKSAAVADYAPKNIKGEKIKKQDSNMTLELKKNPDILQELGNKKSNQVLIGFAAETNNTIVNAQDKLKRKNLDFIVLNDLTEAGAGFAKDTNIVTILHSDGRIEKLPKMLKRDLADEILNRVLLYLQNRMS